MRQPFSFFRAGGFNQVRFESGADLLNLGQLDQKLWVALACPTKGLVFDARTLELIDSDGDGRIRANELIAAVEWAGKLLKNADDLLRAPSELPLAAINNGCEEGIQVLEASKTVLQGLGKGEASSISVADSADALKSFNAMRFNGDGVITADPANPEAANLLIEDILATLGSVEDRSGKPGVNADKVAEFFKAIADYLAWYDKAQSDSALLPFQADTAAALAALNSVRSKIDDFFVRCQLAEFDARAIAALNREEKEYYALTAQDLVISNDEIRRLPLAHVEAAIPLPLKKGLNPAWAEAMQAFVSKVVAPLLGDIEQLTMAQWHDIKSRLTHFEAWQFEKAGAAVEKLGIDRVRALSVAGTTEQLTALFELEKAQEVTANAIASVERLVRYVRDLHQLALNFVNFQQFYARKTPAIFQVGTLYLDQRATELCLRVDDVPRHALMAPLSRVYLAYCDCVRRSSGEKITIAAGFTNGDSDSLMVGRNGIFYDREGKDWDATITKLVENPISLRQAFFSPYKKLLRFIEDQVARRAASSDAASNTLLTSSAEKMSSAATTGKADAIAPKKMDVGVVAAMGVAVGGIVAALGAILQTFFGLGLWMPLGLLGLILVISGPSMVIAWLKLRQRNLGPLLDANGWAVNAHARVNVPFGASLTKIATLPKGSRLDPVDPFAEKKRPWKLYVLLALFVVLDACWWFGKLDAVLPASMQHGTVIGAELPAAKPLPAA